MSRCLHCKKSLMRNDLIIYYAFKKLFYKTFKCQSRLLDLTKIIQFLIDFYSYDIIRVRWNKKEAIVKYLSHLRDVRATVAHVNKQERVQFVIAIDFVVCQKQLFN